MERVPILYFPFYLHLILLNISICNYLFMHWIKPIMKYDYPSGFLLFIFKLFTWHFYSLDIFTESRLPGPWTPETVCNHTKKLNKLSAKFTSTTLCLRHTDWIYAVFNLEIVCKISSLELLSAEFGWNLNFCWLSLFTMALTLVGPWSCGHPVAPSLTHI